MIISGDDMEGIMVADSKKGVGTRDRRGDTDDEMPRGKFPNISKSQGNDAVDDDGQRVCEIEGRDDEPLLKWSPVMPAFQYGIGNGDLLDSHREPFGNHEQDNRDVSFAACERAESGAFHPEAMNDDDEDDAEQIHGSSFPMGGYQMLEALHGQEKPSGSHSPVDHFQLFASRRKEGTEELEEDHRAFGMPDFHTDDQVFGGDEHPETLYQVPCGKYESPLKRGHANSNPRIINTPQGPALLLSPPAKASSARAVSSLVFSGQKRKFQRWSEEEDTILRHAVSTNDETKPNWKEISITFFSGTRSALQCKSRWIKALEPGRVIGSWQEHEDDIIRHLRAEGFKWSQIADQLPGRIGEHVRDRFVNYLDPDLKKTPWTKQEDMILFEQQKLHGNKWTAIAKLLPGRSENAVKNRWHNAKMTQRRRMRKHANERSLVAQSMRARQHVANAGSEDGSWDGDEAVARL